LYDKPPPLDGTPWRIIYWREDGRWVVYVFRGHHWRGAGFHMKYLSEAVLAAKTEARRAMKQRRLIRLDKLAQRRRASN
jgi:hypothetical protein